MPISVELLPEDEKSFLQHLIEGTYLDGHCYEFAIALHRGLGWPMIGLMQSSGKSKVIRHVVLKGPLGHFDCRGYLNKKDAKKHSLLPSSYTLLPVTEDMLRAVRPINERDIDVARNKAETLWTSLPWRQRRIDKFVAFLTELEALCLKHGVWIRSGGSIGRPIVEDIVGDETGFNVRASGIGNGFSFDRTLRK